MISRVRMARKRLMVARERHSARTDKVDWLWANYAIPHDLQPYHYARYRRYRAYNTLRAIERRKDRIA